MTKSGAQVLSVRDVSVEFSLGRGRTLRAVDGASFDLHAGEVLGVVGESGSGKSTLGKVVAGMLNPTSGEVFYAGAQGDLEPRKQRKPRGFRDVQMIFQESAMALNPRLPVWRLVGEAIKPGANMFPSLGRGSLRDLREQAGTFVERAGLNARDVLSKRVDELSGGEKQRVSIARALAASPIAMVCDESVSALDVSIRAVVLNLFQRLSRETNVALLFITHDISVVAHLADRIAVMNTGSVVELDTPARVVEAPGHDYTRRLIEAVPTLERRLEGDANALSTISTGVITNALNTHNHH